MLHCNISRFLILCHPLFVTLNWLIAKPLKSENLCACYGSAMKRESREIVFYLSWDWEKQLRGWEEKAAWCGRKSSNSVNFWTHSLASVSLFCKMMITPVLSCCKEETRLEALYTSKMEKEVATHSSILAWRILWTEETGGLLSMGSHRVRQSQTRLKRLNMHARIGEGNGNPLQYSCLKNPRDGGAWWATFYGVAQSGTRLKWLSSSSSSILQKGLRSK